MGTFFRRLMLKKFFKACKKDMSRIYSIISGMSYLYGQESINNNFSTYNCFVELLRQITDITNNATRFCSIDKLDFRVSKTIDDFLLNFGLIFYLDSDADLQMILVEDAQKLVPMSDNAVVLNPVIGLTGSGYSEHLAVHTALMNTYNTCIEFFKDLYNKNEEAG